VQREKNLRLSVCKFLERERERDGGMRVKKKGEREGHGRRKIKEGVFVQENHLGCLLY